MPNNSNLSISALSSLIPSISNKRPQEIEERMKKTKSLKEDLINDAINRINDFTEETIESHLNFTTLPKGAQMETIFSKFPYFASKFVTRGESYVQASSVLQSANQFKIKGINMREVMNPIQFTGKFYRQVKNGENGIKSNMTTDYDRSMRAQGKIEYIENEPKPNEIVECTSQEADTKAYSVPAGCLPLNSQAIALHKTGIFVYHKVTHDERDDGFKFPAIPGGMVS